MSTDMPPAIRRKVMVIGLDGLTLKLLLPLVAAGQLPTFARLLREGAHGVLRSVTNMTTGPTWASFATGCEPVRHAVLHDFHHRHDSYELLPTTGRDRRMPSFWEVASEAGRTAIVLNVPHSYPARPLRGVLLAGVDAPSELAPGFDYPPGSFRALRRSTGDYIIDCGLASYMQAGRLSEGVAAVERETEGRTRAAEYFLARLDWDLLVVVYSLPDVWQHYRWAALHAAPDRAGRELIYDGYRTMDRHLARLLRHLPPDGLAVICSDHGFGPLCGTRDQLNNWLASQGLLHYQSGAWRGTRAHLSRALLNAARRRVSFRLRQQALAALPPLRRTVETRLRVGGIDWAQTQAYAALDHQELWINVRGRQPTGCVDPDDYEQLCKQLAVALLEWCDEQGRPYINAVHTQPYADAAADDYLPPDLLLEWNPAAAQPNLHPLISGDHDPEGALIIAGPGVRPQRLADRSLLDIAPLALYGLGVPIPGSIQGRIPEDLC
ncbi:alkaline phosphatase family protein [Candidatus Chloroploca sp. Khr17]|uniref:alkaline phosphatase family protein n=1 Tax=Candidatus Chloroploca sp. Khr17 TaxID=2496869 RepID=UPI00101DA41C|nr:alkaline phosphatase family protein [Candidatus Chloroploca sp. Khr17]